MILIIGEASGARHSSALTLLAGMLAFVLTLAACVTQDESSNGPLIVTTTNILGDIAANVIGDEGTVVSLIPVGVDPHDYRPSSREVAMITRADLVIANGLGLEPGLEDILKAARADGVVVLEVAPLLDPLPFREGEGLDPHFWMDPLRVALAAENIQIQLEVLNLPGQWVPRSLDYRDRLLEARERMADVLERVSPADRKLITNHDALGYFADRFGFEVLGVVIPGGSTLAEPSSSALAELIAVIEAEQVPAIFVDTSDSAALAEAIAAETGVDVAIIELYTGSMGGPGSGADTVIDMLLTDARLVAEALG